jgi:hypothetical protein
MRSNRIFVFGGLLAALLLVGAGAANAIPSLQLGEGDVGDWTYDLATDTWVTASNPFELLATANATTGKGAYAWSTSPDPNQYAYLVVSAVPKTALTEPPELFDITISNATFATSGNGAPPLSDSNDLAPHGIFDTYFEIYEFQFDGPVVTIDDTQPGGGGSGDGFEERFLITVNDMVAPVEALHFDLFTIEGLGQLNNTSVVESFAPFSHDAQFVPEPGATVAFATGLLIVGAALRRRQHR